MKKMLSLGGLLIAMFFVAFSTGCAPKTMANPLGPSDPVVNPTPAPTACVTNCPTAVPTPVTHTHYFTFTAPPSTSIDVWIGKFITLPVVVRSTTSVPAGGVWTSTVVTVGAEVYHSELLCNSANGTLQEYMDGVTWGSPTSLTAGTPYYLTY